MDYTVNEEKMNQAAKYLKEEDIDLWLILTSEGSDPCLPLVTGVKTVGPGAFIITKSNKKYAVCSSIDAQDIEESELFDEVVKYKNGLEKPLKELILSLAPDNIALNYSKEEHLCDGLTVGRYRWLTDVLNNDFKGEFVSSESFLIKLRSIKSKEEIKRITEAIRITQEIYDAVKKQLKTGLSEEDVGELFVEEMKKRDVVNGGSKGFTMPIVMKERIAHRGPGKAVLKPGDFMIVDFSVSYKGYVSDIARTFYFLKENETSAPKEMQEAFEAAHGAISEAAEALEPKKKGYEVDKVARDYLLDNGMPEITHATGHQIGRETHDGGTLLGPRWERYGKAPYGEVKEGMIFTLEPTIFTDDNGPNILVEENLLVTEDGAKYLSKRQNNLYLID